MSANPPFDLGSLGDVESPEVVKEALRTFRRRSMRTAIWSILVIAMLGVPLVSQAFSKNLMDNIKTADGYDAGTVYVSRGVTVVLARVARLGDATGLHLIVSGAAAKGDNDVHVDLPNREPVAMESGDHRIVDGWYVLHVSSDGLIRLEVHVIPHCEPVREGNTGFSSCGGVRRIDPNDRPTREFTIDLKAAGVPERLWRKGEGR